MVSHSSDVASLHVLSLRSQVPEGVLTIGRDQPRLTWRFAATDVVQTGYEIEAGLLEPADWSPARAITLHEDPGRDRQAPAPVLRREFELDHAPVHARLHVTSLGLHEIRINGQRVGDQLLAPGWTTYRKRLLADTHDVTNL